MKTNRCGLGLVLLAALLAVFVLCATVPVIGATYYVSETGNDSNDGSAADDAHAWATITNGEVYGGTGVLQPGDTVEVQDGYYEVMSPLVITHSGTVGNPITYHASGGAVLFYWSAPAWDVLLKVDGANYVTIDGFNFSDCTNSVQLLNSASYVTIANCYFHTDSAILGGPYHFIDMVGTPGGSDAGAQANVNVGCVIRNNILRNNAYAKWEHMIWAQYDSDLLICNNVIDGANYYALELEFDTNSVIENNVFVNNGIAIGGWPDPAQVKADHNLYFNNSANDNGYCTHGDGEITGKDPLFAGGVPPQYPPVPFDPPFDYHLTETSPCVDAGIVAYTGQGYNNSAPDIGAFESPYGMPTSLAVTVTSPGGTPLAGATVEIPSLALSELTDYNGQVTFFLAPGNYTVNASVRDATATASPTVVIGANDLTLTLAYTTKNTYYVKNGGDDYADGLTLGTAWATIGNGDVNKLLLPGDTVLVEPGTYYAGVSVNCSGEDGNPITYRADGPGAIVSVGSTGVYPFYIGKGVQYIVIDGFDIPGPFYHGIGIEAGNYCVVQNCRIHDSVTDYQAGVNIFAVAGSPAMHAVGNIIRNNVIYNMSTAANDYGILTCGLCDQTQIYNNTIADCSNGIALSQFNGIDIGDIVKNNIVTGCSVGYSVRSASIVDEGNNDFFNTAGDPVTASDIYADPQFVGGSPFDYNLTACSPCADAGVVVYEGQPYNNAAPDMGALESSYTSPTSLAVTVTSPGGTPLPGVTVEVPSLSLSAVTGSAGQAMFTCIDPGAYTVNASGVRGATATGDATVVVGTTNHLDLTLNYTTYTFHVKTGGDDNADGLTLDTAWASIANGDAKKILLPGDTVLVEPGTYITAVSLANCPGDSNPITYLANGPGTTVSVGSTSAWPFHIGYGMRNIVIDGFDVPGPFNNGIAIEGANYCVIQNCYIHDAGGGTVGVSVYGWPSGSPTVHAVGNIIRNNVFNNIAGDYGYAILTCGLCDQTQIYNNTIVNGNWGFVISQYNGPDIGDVIKNNIVSGCYGGYYLGNAESTVDEGNNLFYDTAYDPASAGDIHADPLFAGGTADYGLDLANFSPAIDHGVVLYAGQPYNGSAPDMGAFESSFARPTFPSTTKPLVDVKNQPDDTAVATDPLVVTGAFGNTFYLEQTNRAQGIRVDMDPAGVWLPSVYPLAAGQTVQVSGRIETDATTEKYILASQIENTGTGSVLPLMTINKNLGNAVGLNTVGLLVATTGTVTSSYPDWFVIDDGSGAPVAISSDLAPAVGAYLSVIGDSSCWLDGSTVRSLLRAVSTPVVNKPAP